jgi:hypothetical protein
MTDRPPGQPRVAIVSSVAGVDDRAALLNVLDGLMMKTG